MIFDKENRLTICRITSIIQNISPNDLSPSSACAMTRTFNLFNLKKETIDGEREHKATK